MPEPRDEAPIRITAAEAGGSHVDDLLRRQANLRGDTGISRNHSGSWWYQSWFFLMLAGGVAAFLSWAVIEPYYNDAVEVRGVVGKIEVFDPPRLESVIAPLQNDPQKLIQLPILATLTVRGETIAVTAGTVDLATQRPLTPSRLSEGKVVQAYTEPLATPAGKVLWVADAIELTPTAQEPDSTFSQEQLLHRNSTLGMLLFALTAACIGLGIGAVDGVVCRMWRRAALSGLVGLAVGSIGGLVLSIIANLIYAPMSMFAAGQEGGLVHGMNALGFAVQVLGRCFAWGLVGIAMGLGQGIALRSNRLLVFGLIGGVAGGVIGGLLFDPIDLLRDASDVPSAWLSRMVGITVIGLSVGAMIGVVELLARDAWLRMEQGPLAGKEFLVFKDVMRIGASSRSDIYLFNDPLVLDHHATLRASGEAIEIESANQGKQVLVNDRPVRLARLRHGDRIGIGRTVFVYQQRGG